MVGCLVVGLDSGSDVQSKPILFRVVLGSEGLGFEGGCVLGFLVEIERLGLDRGGGSFLLVGSLGLGWLI